MDGMALQALEELVALAEGLARVMRVMVRAAVAAPPPADPAGAGASGSPAAPPPLPSFYFVDAEGKLVGPLRSLGEGYETRIGVGVPY